MSVTAAELATTDPDAAHELLNRMYAPDRPITFRGSAQDFQFAIRSVQAGDLHASRIRHTMQTRALTHPFHDFIAATVVSGSIRWDLRHEELAIPRGGVFAYSTDGSALCTWPGVDVVLLRVPLGLVEEVAAERTDIDPHDLRFDGQKPRSAASAEQWRRLTGFVNRSLEAQAAVEDSPLVLAELARLVASTALAVFPNTTMTLAYRPDPGWVAPSTVRRAAAYVDAHAAEPITATDVAKSAGVTPRALQTAFRRHLGTTPNAYLRRARLAGAHRDLQAADPAGGETVASVAAAWGLTSGARFGEFYRREFGTTPSHTLRT